MTEQDAIRVLLVDDHPVVRRGVAQIIVESYPHAVIRENCSSTDALGSARNDRWDLVILDLTLPDGSGLDVLKQIKKAQADVPVMILSVHPGEQFARRCAAAGASGYLTKDAAGVELTTAIARVIRGGTYFGDQVAEEIASGSTPDGGEQSLERLSDREYEVLRLIGEGKTVSEIANVLTISVKTVSTYRTRLLTKMGMRTNAELMHYALRTGLMRP
jgi:two-component system invasion response regulator UvrY